MPFTLCPVLIRSLRWDRPTCDTTGNDRLLTEECYVSNTTARLRRYCAGSIAGGDYVVQIRGQAHGESALMVGDSERIVEELRMATGEASYRCVCGADVSIELDGAGCSECGRAYNRDVLKAATAETIAVDLSEGMPQIVGSGRTPSLPDEFVDRKLGHFRVLAPLGSGGMGTVYRALDESLQRYVALKVLRTGDAGASDADLQRLFQEARAQARVNHPNVAHIYYVGREEEIPYLAMELVGNQTLADKLSNGGLPFAVIVSYALQIARALEAAAKFDIVHGDIKPANMLLMDDRTVKLSDFGMASRASESGSEAATIAGTPDYMPPEATLGKSIDHRGDMYSLGVTLFEMTFGRLPFGDTDSDVDERLRQHRRAAVEFPDPWPVELPQAWQDMLTKLLAKQPDDRYDDFTALVTDLRRVEPVTLPPAGPFPRSLAWFFDCFLISLPLTIIALASSLSQLQIIPFFGSLLTGLVVVAVCGLQAAWKTTPGKRLFQIRIVDQHGLVPPKSVLTVRAALQFVWAWPLVVTNFVSSLGIPYASEILDGVVALFVLADIVAGLLPTGRSIHDRILHTRVVLDA